jgi:chemotaxis protein CheD
VKDKSEQVVGLAQIFVSADPCVLSCPSIGSSVALLGFDPKAGVVGLAHALLPVVRSRQASAFGKYVETAVPELLNRMTALGAEKDSTSLVLVGGAVSTQWGNTKSAGGQQLGERNVAKALAMLEELGGERLKATDVGGNMGRTLTFDTATGEVRVQTTGKGSKVVCRFAIAARSGACRQA